MPQSRFKVTDRQTGKQYTINWDGVNPPSDDDIDEMLGSQRTTLSYQPEEDTRDIGDQLKLGVYDASQPVSDVSKVVDKYNPTRYTAPPTAKSRLGDIGSGIGKTVVDLAKSGFNPVQAAQQQTAESVGNYISNSNYQGAPGAAKFGAEMLGFPVSNLQEDWKRKSFGAGAVDLTQAGLSAFGAKELLHGAPEVLSDTKNLFKGLRPSLFPLGDIPVNKWSDFPTSADVARDLTADGPVPSKVGTVELPPVQPVEPWDFSTLDKQPEIRNPRDYQSTEPLQTNLATGELPARRPEQPIQYEKTKGIKNIPTSQDIENAKIGLPQKGVPSTKRVALTGQGEPDINVTVPNRLRPEATNVTVLDSLVPDRYKGAPELLPPANEGFKPFNWESKGLPPIESVKTLSPKLDTSVADNINIPKSVVPDVTPVDETVKPTKPEVKPVDLSNTPEPGNIDNLKFINSQPVLKSLMDKWIKDRATGSLIGRQVRNQFSNIANLTKDDLIPFQQGLAEGKNPEVRDFFNKQLENLQANNIDVEKKGNYLPLLFDNTPAEVEAALGEKTLSTKASFQFHSVLKDYEQAAKAVNPDGTPKLNPKFSPVELMDWYAQRANKLIADTKFFNAAKDAGYILPSNKAPVGWQDLDPNNMPVTQYKDSNGNYQNINYAAHPSVKAVLENYLKTPDNLASKTSKVSGVMAGLKMSAGIPNVPAATWHGTNIAYRSMFADGLKGTLRTLKYGLTKSAGSKLIDSELPQIIDATKEHGYNPGVYNPNDVKGQLFKGDDLGKTKSSLNWLYGKQQQYFEKPLFDSFMPAMKWSSWKDHFADFQAKGMSKAEAGAAATKFTDDNYSGANLDLLYRNKDFQNYAKILTLAPGWYESTAKLGINIPKSAYQLLKDPSNPVAQAYVKTGARVLATYAAANILNKSITGHFMMSNDKGHEFDIPVGNDGEGKSMYVNVGNTSMDMLKLPLQAMKTTINDKSLQSIPDIMTSKGSALTSLAGEFFGGEDYQGKPNIFKSKDNFGNSILLSTRLGNTANMVVNAAPPQISNPINVATGNMGLLQGVSGLTEAPLKFGYNKKQKSPFNFNIRP